MLLRECNVWGVHKKFLGRMKDRLKHGHTKHLCKELRPFGYEHEGDHKCSCGFTYPLQETDNKN